MLQQLVHCILQTGNVFSNFVKCSGVASGKGGGGGRRWGRYPGGKNKYFKLKKIEFWGSTNFKLLSEIKGNTMNVGHSFC
jgi:hypothetical protein